MMSVPGFQHRGSGIRILNRFRYRAEDLNCRYCLHYQRKGCIIPVCPYIAERLESGAIGYRELVMECFGTIPHTAFSSESGLWKTGMARIRETLPGWKTGKHPASAKKRVSRTPAGWLRRIFWPPGNRFGRRLSPLSHTPILIFTELGCTVFPPRIIPYSMQQNGYTHGNRRWQWRNCQTHI